MAECDNVIMDQHLPSKSLTVFHWVEGRPVIEERQEVSDIIQSVKDQAAHGTRPAKGTVFWPAARVPNVIIADLRRKWDALNLGKDERNQAFKDYLNGVPNPANSEKHDTGSVWKFDKSFRL